MCQFPFLKLFECQCDENLSGKLADIGGGSKRSDGDQHRIVLLRLVFGIPKRRYISPAHDQGET